MQYEAAIECDKSIGTVTKHDTFTGQNNNKNSSGDEIANVNFCTMTTYMERPVPTPIEPTC